MTDKTLRSANGAPVVDNNNSLTAGPRGPVLMQDLWLMEKLAHFDRERIPERVVHAKGSGAYGTFTLTHDISQFSKADLFNTVGKQTPVFQRFSTVADGLYNKVLNRCVEEGKMCMHHMMAIDEMGGEAYIKAAGLNLPQDVCTVKNADSVVALLDQQRAQAAAVVQ